MQEMQSSFMYSTYFLDVSLVFLCHLRIWDSLPQTIVATNTHHEHPPRTPTTHEQPTETFVSPTIPSLLPIPANLPTSLILHPNHIRRLRKLLYTTQTQHTLASTPLPNRSQKSSHKSSHHISISFLLPSQRK